MGTICLNLISSSVFILTVVTAQLHTYVDHGDCVSASSTDRLNVSIMEPKVYNVELQIRPVFDTSWGTCVILIQVHKRTRMISLHAYKIQTILHEITLLSMNRDVYSQPVKYRYCQISQILDLYFDKDIVPAHYYLELPLIINLKHGTYRGLRKYHYRPQETHRGWLVTNLFQPNMLRSIFPCWDEPEIKAHFNISIWHTSEYIVLSNMPKKDILNTNNLQCIYFEVSPLISPSEVVIVMFEDKLLPVIVPDVRYKLTKIIWHYPERTQLRCFYSIVGAVRYSLFIDLLDQITVPKTVYILIPHGPMKAAGFGNFSIYREKDVSCYSTYFPGRKMQIWKLLAYQEVLQWFDRVGISRSWFDMFPESFATYFSYNNDYYPFKSDNDTQLQDLFTVQILQPLLHYDIALRMKPLYDIDRNDEIHRCLFSRLYGYKGAIVLRMLENILTPNDFRQRILESVNILKSFPNVLHNVFWHRLKYYKDDVNETETSRQKRDNISVIMNSLRQEKFSELFIKQDRKSLNITADCDKSAKWNISINIYAVTKVGLQNIINNTRIECPGVLNMVSKVNFIIVHLYQLGYYRVNYDDAGWGKISRYLQYGKYMRIPVQNRAQLIDDAYYYLRGGKIASSIFFNLIDYLKRETHYVPWYTMFNILSYLSNYMKLPQSSYTQGNVLDILDSLLTNIGYIERYEDDEMMNSLRLLATRWACKLGHTKCQETATSALLLELNPSSEKPVLPWWKDWVRCMGMKKMESTKWHSIFSDFENMNISKYMACENMDILKYLACTDDDTLLVYYMNALITDEHERIINLIGRAESANLYRSILKRNIIREAVLNHVLENLNKIAERIYGMEDTRSLWGDILFNLVDRKKMDMVLRFSRHVVEELSPDRKVITRLYFKRLSQIFHLSTKFYLF